MVIKIVWQGVEFCVYDGGLFLANGAKKKTQVQGHPRYIQSLSFPLSFFLVYFSLPSSLHIPQICSRAPSFISIPTFKSHLYIYIHIKVSTRRETDVHPHPNIEQCNIHIYTHKMRNQEASCLIHIVLY